MRRSRKTASATTAGDQVVQVTITATADPGALEPTAPAGLDRPQASRVSTADGDYAAFLRQEHLANVRRMRGALGLGVVLWFGFGLLDVVVASLVPNIRLGIMLGIRVVPIAVLVPALWILSRREPPSQRAVVGLERSVTTATAGATAFLALEFWGLTSPYLTGVGLILVVRAFMLSDPWRRGVVSLGLPLAVHLAILLGASLFRADVAAQLADRNALLVFGINELINLTFFFLIVALGHRLFTLRRQLFEARHIGRYQLRRRIGGGGMGEIWAAYHPSLRREVALKIMRPGTINARRVARFEREVRATSELAHPNTIRVFDYGTTDDGLWYYAMELLVGEDLGSLVRRDGAQPAARAVRLVEQAARALAEAHHRQILHRDIKPENLFLVRLESEADVIKVLDFGLAKILEPEPSDLTHEGAVFGTTGYMAPEIISGRSSGVAGDIYALGATLYFLLAGRPPFVAPTAAALLAAQLEQQPEPPSRWLGAQLPAELEALVMRCLDRSPEARPGSANELAELLRQQGGAV
ncbi:MAG TPA: serine/threonine-protein kinase [Kofleriaceae bacterium]|nr:serine/threonine-protein kinase [Kofleriaceae bacterium]